MKEALLFIVLPLCIQLVALFFFVRIIFRKAIKHKALLFLILILFYFLFYYELQTGNKISSGEILNIAELKNMLLSIFFAIAVFIIYSVNENLILTKHEKANCENLYTTLFKNSSDEIFLADRDGKIIEFNNRVPCVLGYTTSELTQLYIQDICLSGLMASIVDFVDRITLGELVFESELKTKDKKVYPVEIKSKLIKHYDKDAILCISRDISERKQIERKILNAIIETEHKERERFSKDLHDQLGNILSSMNIYCELIKSATIDEIERENLMGYFKGLLNEAISSTKEIANNINPNIIADFGLIASAQAYCEKINQTGLLKIYLTTCLKDNVLSKDFEVNFYKIITELVNNTLKHALADRVYIAISQENGNLIIKYEDNGIGFDYPKMIKEKTNKGMGLFNIASRVAAMGGKLSVESNKTIGTRVKIITNIF